MISYPNWSAAIKEWEIHRVAEVQRGLIWKEEIDNLYEFVTQKCTENKVFWRKTEIIMPSSSGLGSIDQARERWNNFKKYFGDLDLLIQTHLPIPDISKFLEETAKPRLEDLGWKVVIRSNIISFFIPLQDSNLHIQVDIMCAPNSETIDHYGYMKYLRFYANEVRSLLWNSILLKWAHRSQLLRYILKELWRYTDNYGIYTWEEINTNITQEEIAELLEKSKDITWTSTKKKDFIDILHSAQRNELPIGKLESDNTVRKRLKTATGNQEPNDKIYYAIKQALLTKIYVPNYKDVLQECFDTDHVDTFEDILSITHRLHSEEIISNKQIISAIRWYKKELLSNNKNELRYPALEKEITKFLPFVNFQRIEEIEEKENELKIYKKTLKKKESEVGKLKKDVEKAEKAIDKMNIALEK